MFMTDVVAPRDRRRGEDSLRCWSARFAGLEGSKYSGRSPSGIPAPRELFGRLENFHE